MRYKQIVQTVGLEEKEVVKNTSDVAQVVISMLNSEDENTRLQEHFWVFGLDTKHRIKIIHLASLGGFMQTPIDPRVIFKTLLINHCCSFICVHNHPDNSIKFSNEDKSAALELHKAAELMKIRLLDFIIVGNNGQFSSIEEKP